MANSVEIDYIEAVAKLRDQLIIILNLAKVLSTGQAATVVAAASDLTDAQ